MKKNSRVAERHPAETMGIDLGDKMSRDLILNEEGLAVEEGSFRNTAESIAKHFARRGRARVAMEVGTQPAWISREFAQLGHEVIVANAGELKWITSADDKNDRNDARKLARLALAGLVEHLRAALSGLLEQADALGAQIRDYGRRIEADAARHPEVARLASVPGVGTLTAAAFVLTLGRRERFAHSRDVGAFLGLRPRQRQSGERDPQPGISKSGDKYLRKLGAVRAPHPRALGQGFGAEAMGISEGRRRRGEETRGGGRGPEAGGRVAPAVDDRGSFQTLS
jgi:transposase